MMRLKYNILMALLMVLIACGEKLEPIIFSERDINECVEEQLKRILKGHNIHNHTQSLIRKNTMQFCTQIQEICKTDPHACPTAAKEKRWQHEIEL